MDAIMQEVVPDESVSDEEDEAKFEKLPYELLLIVLGYLDTEQLLRVRAVNRQCRDAALDPVLWRRRRLDRFDYNLPFGLHDAVLRLAPCLRELVVCCDARFLELERHCFVSMRLAWSTQCAVEDLCVRFDLLGTGYAAMVVRHQWTLGRLRALRLDPKDSTDMREPALALIVDEVCHLKGLVELTFFSDGGDRHEVAASSFPAPEDIVPASLKELSVASWVPVSHLEFLLRSHAPTLERVSVYCRYKGAELLSRASNLVQLTCSLMRNMTALLQCTSLTELTLDVDLLDCAEPAVLREANDFLRRAATLKDVTFQYCDGQEGSQAELVRALASPHHAAVEKISFVLVLLGLCIAGDMTERFVVAFAETLPWLTGLREVHVVGDPLASFLEALSPASAPNLRLLKVEFSETYETGRPLCAHSFMHRAEVRDVLVRNPLLHVEVISNPAKALFCGDDCEPCVQGCHSQLHGRLGEIVSTPEGELEYGVVTLYSHPEGGTCDVSHPRNIEGETSLALPLMAL